MTRTRAWRRYKDYTKAKRKRNKDASTAWYGHLWYDNLHQYSKNKIHCSCPMCRAKTKRNDYYVVGYTYTMMDKRRADAMDASEFDFFENS